MRATPASVGARGADSDPFSRSADAARAAMLRSSGIDFVFGYLGTITLAFVQIVLAAGLGFMPVTYAGEYEDGPNDEIAQLKALGIPTGVSVWLDLEGLKAYHSDIPTLIAKINAWADGIAAAGWMPCLYVGAPQPLTSAELHALHVVRYWKGQGRCVDRFNALAEPTNGWCLTQMWPSVLWPEGHAAQVLVDLNIVGEDYKARLPVLVVA